MKLDKKLEDLQLSNDIIANSINSANIILSASNNPLKIYLPLSQSKTTTLYLTRPEHIQIIHEAIKQIQQDLELKHKEINSKINQIGLLLNS